MAEIFLAALDVGARLLLTFPFAPFAHTAEKEEDFKHELSDRVKELYDVKEEVCLSLEKLGQLSRTLASSRKRMSKDDQAELGVAYAECSLSLRRALLLMEKGHLSLTMLHAEGNMGLPYQHNVTSDTPQGDQGRHN
jgi:hypothetical protein